MNLTAEALDLENYASINFKATADTDSGLQSAKITKFCNTFDILPTILQLCGYNYNMNLYQGVSMFSDIESVFVSHESGIFVDDIYFSTINLYVRNGETWDSYVFDETFLAGGFSDEVLGFLYSAVDYYDKQTMLDAVILNDYFSTNDFYVGEGNTVFIEKVS